MILEVQYQQRVHLIDSEDSARSMRARICAAHGEVGTQAATHCSVSGVLSARAARSASSERAGRRGEAAAPRAHLEAAGSMLTGETRSASSASRSADMGRLPGDQRFVCLDAPDRVEHLPRRAGRARAQAERGARPPTRRRSHCSVLAVRQRRQCRAARTLATCLWCLKRGHNEEERYRKCNNKPRIDPRADRRGNAYFATEPAMAPPDRVYHVYTALSTTPAACVWYLDSGASNHCCREASFVDSVQPCAKPSVVSADGSSLPIAATGTVTLRVSPARRG